MRPIVLALVLGLALLPAMPAVAVERIEDGNRVMENLPAVPPELIERLEQYQNTRGASLAGWLQDGSLLITTRFGDTAQVHRVSAPLGMREQLTFHREPVSAVTPAPAGGARGFVFGKDVGGSEFWQLHWYDLESREVRMLSDGGRSQNTSPLWSHDGRQLAWASTARNGTDYDLWLYDMAGGRSRIVLQEGGLWIPADFSPDGKRLLVVKYVSINESHPGELELASGKLRMFPVEGGKAGFRAFRYAPDGRSVYYVSDEGREFQTLFHHDPRGGAPVALSAHVPWDVERLAIASDGRHLAYVSNEDGIGRLRVLSLPEHRELDLPELPIGVIAGLDFSPDGSKLALTLNSATSPSDVYVLDLGTRELAAWTRSEVGGLDASRVGVMGGSYGGYMVLASMVHYNDRLRAGIDVVGISHFRTFLENTESYRRDLRRAEYGDERVAEIAEFHEKIAPLNNASRITRPLFVAQGFNDPRVPWTEAEQIVKAVRGNGGEVWYLMFRDEGHGFRKKANSDFFGAAAMLFWQEHLLGE